MGKLKLYSATWCSDCRRAKEYLREKNIVFEETDIEAHPEAVDIIVQARGKRVLPTLEFEGKFMDGNHFNREKFEEDLKNLGILK